VGYPYPAAEWRGLAPSRPLALFQLSLQARVLVAQPIALALDPLGPLAPLFDFFPQPFIVATSVPPLITKRGNGAFKVMDEGEWTEGLRERHSRCCASPYRNRKNLYSGNRQDGVRTANVGIQIE
jgi:hypothetical protein